VTRALDFAHPGTYVRTVRDALDRISARGNPFDPERVAGLRYRLAGTTWEAVLDDLDALGWEAAVRGPAGTGKTRLLAGLAHALRQAGFRAHVHRPRGSRRTLPGFGVEVDARSVLLVDDADALGAWERWRILRLGRRIAGLVVASREPFPRLPELLVTRTSPELLEDLAAELAPWGPRPGPVAMRRLYLRHGGDLRAALAELRARHAAETGPDAVAVADAGR